jgi:hypothetical protein
VPAGAAEVLPRVPHPPARAARRGARSHACTQARRGRRVCRRRETGDDRLASKSHRPSATAALPNSSSLAPSAIASSTRSSAACPTKRSPSTSSANASISATRAVPTPTQRTPPDFHWRELRPGGRASGVGSPQGARDLHQSARRAPAPRGHHSVHALAFDGSDRIGRRRAVRCSVLARLVGMSLRRPPHSISPAQAPRTVRWCRPRNARRTPTDCRRPRA